VLWQGVSRPHRVPTAIPLALQSDFQVGDIPIVARSLMHHPKKDVAFFLVRLVAPRHRFYDGAQGFGNARLPA